MKPARSSKVSQDRWLVSYADFITLLFGLFVVLYAFARADQKKQQQVSAAIDVAFHSMGLPMTQAGRGEAVSEPGAVVNLDVLSAAEVRDDLDRIRRELTGSLSGQMAAGTVSVAMRSDGLVISLREAGFFASGSAEPKPGTLPVLQKIAASIHQTPYDVRIEGHTDNVPIHNAQFASNWELSTARATRIARLFLELNAISPERISAAGYAQFHPIASNATADGRARNRRVDLVILPRTRLNFAAMPAAPSGPWRKVTDGDR